MKKVYLEVRACEQRKLENEQIKQWLHNNGYILEPTPEKADFCVITTCGVDKCAVEKSEEMIESMLGFFDSNRIIVGGCLPEIEKTFFQDHYINKTFTPKEFEKINELIPNNIGIESVGLPTLLEDENNQMVVNATGYISYNEAKKGHKIVISKGCLNHCAYCAIKSATGRLKSRSISEIISQINALQLEPGSSIMLMAGDTGAYGRDIGTSLCELLQTIIQLKKHILLFVHDLNLKWIVQDMEYYIRVLKEDRDKTIRVMNIPIQSGSNRILELMKRGYKAEQIVSVINEIKGVRSDLCIGTHIMVGFPSETESDFQRTIEVLQSSKIDFITCFPYSEHYVAKSYYILPKVGQQIIDRRLKILKSIFGNRITVCSKER